MLWGRNQDSIFLYSFLNIYPIEAIHLFKRQCLLYYALSKSDYCINVSLFLASIFPPLFHLSTFGQILTIKTSIYQMTIKNMKRQTTKWEKLLAKYISDKPLVSRICKEFANKWEENPTTKLPNRNIGKKTWIWTLKKRICKWPKAMKRCPSSLVISEVQIKTLMH